MRYRTLVLIITTSFLMVGFSLSSLWAAEISRDVRKHMLRGEAAMEEAKDTTDYQDAVNEFKKAIKYAPNWGDAWYNLGVAQESAGDYTGAITSFNKYLNLNPQASDRSTIEDRIIKLEYRQEKARKEILKKQEAEKQKRRDETRPLRLAGDWCCLKEDGSVNCYDYAKIKVVGTTIEVTFPTTYKNYPIRFSGQIQGNKISGSCYNPSRGGCPEIRTSMTGIVSNDGQRIELSYQCPTHWICTKSGQIRDLKTESAKYIFIRKNW